MLPLNPGQQVVNLVNDPGGQYEQSYLTVSGSSTGVFEIFTVTANSFASTAQADYLSFSEPGGETFAVWLDKNTNGTTPTGAIYVAATRKITAAISTGNTAAQVATAIKAACEGNVNFDQYVIGINGAILTFTANKVGAPTDAAPHNTGDTGAGSLSVTVSQQGVAAGSQNKYFTLRKGANSAYYGWLNINSEGSDPSQTGTAVPVTVAAAATDAQVATAIASALDAVSGLESEADGAVVKITNESKASVTDIGAGNSGFTVSVSTQGVAELYDAALNPASISNNPSAF